MIDTIKVLPVFKDNNLNIVFGVHHLRCSDGLGGDAGGRTWLCVGELKWWHTNLFVIERSGDQLNHKLSYHHTPCRVDLYRFSICLFTSSRTIVLRPEHASTYWYWYATTARYSTPLLVCAQILCITTRFCELHKICTPHHVSYRCGSRPLELHRHDH